jgi:hypothetical protein
MFHKHLIDDGLPNLEDSRFEEPELPDNASSSSVVRSPPEKLEKRKGQLTFLSEARLILTLSFAQANCMQELTLLAELTQKVKISSEVRAYLHNIVVFMRLHRAVAGGISALATRHFNMLSQ